MVILFDKDDEDLGVRAVVNTRKGVALHCTVYIRGKRTLLHRAIAERMGKLSPIIDHINGNVLDNRRQNIRPVSHRHNARNNGATGVHFHKKGKKWYAGVTVKTPLRDPFDIVSITDDTMAVLSLGKRSSLQRRANGKVQYSMNFFGPLRALREDAISDRIRLKKIYHDGEIGYRLRNEGYE